MHTIWKLLQAIRFFLELAGLGFVTSMAFFWAYPGAWRGIGLADAVRSASSAKGDATPLAPIASADMVAIMLAVATIVLGVVAFFISIIALIGFSEIKRLASETASQEAAKSSEAVRLFIDSSEVKISSALENLEARFGQVQRNLREELSQASGLSSGQDADAFARAASGATLDPSNG